MNLPNLALAFCCLVPTAAPEQMQVQPSTARFQELNAREQILVTGHQADGKTVDWTSEASYASSDPKIVDVSSTGSLQVRGPGKATIAVRHGSLERSIAVEVDPSATSAVSFRRQVMAVLTKATCNSGACHGAPSGKGGFRLSLLGFEPWIDHDLLTRDASGRRVDRVEPEKSLVLRKASAETIHEGGKLLPAAGADYQLVRQWIEQGAPTDDATPPEVASLEVLPTYDVLEAPAHRQQLKVIAHFADGIARDVTALSLFRHNDEQIATVTPGGLVNFKKPGEVAVLVRYLGKMETKLLIHLGPPAEIAWKAPAAKNFVDELAFARLQKLRIAPSELCSDAEFLRRVSLDLAGQLPSVEQAKKFLDDTSPDKRSRLIDQLLESPAYVDFWTLKWADLLGCNNRFTGAKGAFLYHQWIRSQIGQNTPLDQFAREIVSAEGGNYVHPPAAFYRRFRTPEDQAEMVGQLFMGSRIQCARCHNHPFERWLQDDYYGLAAFFKRIKYKDGREVVHLYNKEEIVYQDRSSEMQHPRTGAKVPPKPLGEPSMPEASDDRLEALADWLTQADNPFFARTLVNRYWFHLFGKGIVDPVDDFRASNPPSQPEVLDRLTEDFVAHGFDGKHLLRTIANSTLYQLSAVPNSTNSEDAKYFSHFQPRMLTAEQLLDALAQVTEVPEKFGSLPLGTRATAIPDGEFQHPFLKTFGRPAKSIACECEREADTNLEQALSLVAGQFLNDRLGSDRSRIARLLQAKASDETIVDELYLAALSRHPTPQERQFLCERLASSADRRKTAEDFLWSIVNLEEFLFQH